MKMVSFKEFWETITAGIYQAICWICNLCGYKDKADRSCIMRPRKR